MESYLYFADGNGANAASDAGMWPLSRFTGVEAASDTTTKVYFLAGTNDLGYAADNADVLTITHADTTTAAGSYHRSKLIAKAIVDAIGGARDGEVITIIDVDNDQYAGEIESIKGDTSFGIAISLDG